MGRALDIAERFEEAMDFYERAVQGHYPKATFNIGFLHRTARGQTRDFEKAAEYYYLAATGALPTGRYALARLYQEGWAYRSPTRANPTSPRPTAISPDLPDHLSCRGEASVIRHACCLSMRADGRPERAGMLERVRDHVGSLPYMRWHQARKIAALISEYDLRDCLELGFFHGVSSAYIAQVLKDGGGGHLTTIDRASARYRRPNIEQLLSDLELTSFVTVYYEEISYTWRLMNLIENNCKPIFDFCYIDGGHNWDDTGFAFFLVARLLRPGGWLLLDDLDWTLEQMPSLPTGKTTEEMTTPQVRKVWELLVKRHPAFHNFREDGRWGYAQKR